MWRTRARVRVGEVPLNSRTWPELQELQELGEEEGGGASISLVEAARRSSQARTQSDGFHTSPSLASPCVRGCCGGQSGYAHMTAGSLSRHQTMILPWQGEARCQAARGVGLWPAYEIRASWPVSGTTARKAVGWRSWCPRPSKVKSRRDKQGRNGPNYLCCLPCFLFRPRLRGHAVTNSAQFQVYFSHAYHVPWPGIMMRPIRREAALRLYPYIVEASRKGREEWANISKSCLVLWH